MRREGRKKNSRRVFGLTLSVDEPLSRSRVGGGQLLFDLGDVLGVKVVEQALTYQVVLETEEVRQISKNHFSHPHELVNNLQK